MIFNFFLDVPVCVYICITKDYENDATGKEWANSLDVMQLNESLYWSNQNILKHSLRKSPVCVNWISEQGCPQMNCTHTHFRSDTSFNSSFNVCSLFVDYKLYD